MNPEHTLRSFGVAVAAGTPAPGGGAVAAVTGALAAALAAMVGRLTLTRAGADPGVEGLITTADSLRDRLFELAQADETAFKSVVEATRTRDVAAIDQAWRAATRIPAEVIRHCSEIAELARRVAKDGPPAALGDAVMAALLAAAAAAGSQVNLRLNVQAAGRPEDLSVLADTSESILQATQRAAAEARLAVEERLGGSGKR